ncbi:hypothetical protein ACFT43_19640 [Streptomyces albidoflavus]
MPELVDREGFRRLFETFRHTAWRLETRRGTTPFRSTSSPRRNDV